MTKNLLKNFGDATTSRRCHLKGGITESGSCVRYVSRYLPAYLSVIFSTLDSWEDRLVNAPRKSCNGGKCKSTSYQDLLTISFPSIVNH